MNQIPRVSPVQYFLGEDLELYSLYAGRDKLKAIKENPNGYLLVNTEFITHREIKGVQIFGGATTSLDDDSLFNEAMKFSPDPNTMNFNREDIKVIKIVPEEIVYLNAIQDGDRMKQILSENQVRIKEDNLMIH